MAAKDTIMDRHEMLCCSLSGKHCFEDVEDVIRETCKHQAEITLKDVGEWLINDCDEIIGILDGETVKYYGVKPEQAEILKQGRMPEGEK